MMSSSSTNTFTNSTAKPLQRLCSTIAKPLQYHCKAFIVLLQMSISVRTICALYAHHMRMTLFDTPNEHI